MFGALFWMTLEENLQKAPTALDTTKYLKTASSWLKCTGYSRYQETYRKTSCSVSSKGCGFSPWDWGARSYFARGGRNAPHFYMNFPIFSLLKHAYHPEKLVNTLAPLVHIFSLNYMFGQGAAGLFFLHHAPLNGLKLPQESPPGKLFEN